MNRIISLVLAVITALVYVGVIIMKFYTPIDIPNGSFIVITLLVIISEGQFINSLH